MAKKTSPRSKHVSSRIRNNSVPKRQQASTKAYTACRSLQTAKAVLDFLGISYSDAGKEYTRLIGGRQTSRQSVYKALNKSRLSDDWLQVLGQLLSNKLTRMCGETIGISIMQNSPMKITPYHYCKTCGSLCPITTPQSRNCQKCVK